MNAAVSARYAPLVSVILPTYQRAQLVPHALHSVLAQTWTDYELIVVNDGSTDNTAEVLAPFGDRITLIQQANQGLSAARNAGIRAAQGQYIAFIDDDDQWLPTKLAQQIPILENRPDIGLVYADAWLFDEDGPLPGSFFSRFPPYAGATYRALLKNNFMLVSTVVLRRACLNEVGGFDETLSAYEDYDLWLRVSQTQWRFQPVHEPVAHYRISATSMSHDTQRMLVNLLQVKEKLLTTNPSLRQQLSPQTLDEHFYRYYLDLARLYLRQAQAEQARAVLDRYRAVRGIDSACLQVWLTSWLPTPLQQRLRQSVQLARSGKSYWAAVRHSPSMLYQTCLSQKKTYLFVLGHMRSYTSLLCHILASHPEISGYAESQLTYSCRSDLLRLRQRVYLAHDQHLKGRFILDKILHNRYGLSASILNRPDVLAIFVLRKPEAAIRSMLRMMASQNKIEKKEKREIQSFSQYMLPFAVAYYVRRLSTLQLYAGSLERKALYLPAEHILEQAQTTHVALQRYLGLDQPLGETYTIFKHTGEPGYSDPSAAIRTGTILPKEKQAAADIADIAIPADALSEARDAYQACQKTLLDRCIS